MAETTKNTYNVALNYVTSSYVVSTQNYNFSNQRAHLVEFGFISKFWFYFLALVQVSAQSGDDGPGSDDLVRGSPTFETTNFRNIKVSE